MLVPSWARGHDDEPKLFLSDAFVATDAYAEPSGGPACRGKESSCRADGLIDRHLNFRKKKKHEAKKILPEHRAARLKRFQPPVDPYHAQFQVDNQSLAGLLLSEDGRRSAVAGFWQEI